MKEIDFTSGTLNKSILKYYFPLLLSNLLQQLYSFVDMVIIGKGLNDNAVAAVGNFLSLSFFITGFIMGITNGFAVNISHEYGKKDYQSLKKHIAISIKLCIYTAIIFTCIGLILLKTTLILMKTDSNLISSCLRYGYFIWGGLIVTIFYNLLSSILRVIGDSRTPLIAVCISSVANIVLDLLTIFIFNLGVLGPAIATILSQFIAVLICYQKLKKTNELNLHKDDFTPNSIIAKGLMKNGIPMALMNSITSIGTIYIQSCINHFGINYTAAYSCGNKYLNLFMLPGITLGFTTSAFVGQNYGAKKFTRIQEGVKISIIIGGLSVIIAFPFIYALSIQLSKLIVSNPTTIDYSALYLKNLAGVIILLYLLFIYRSAVQSLGKPTAPMISGFAEMLLRIIFIRVGLNSLGFKSAIYAEGLAWIGALAINYLAYKHYINKKV